MRSVCWMIKATDTHSEYVIVIAFPKQQWLGERASTYVCTHIACLVAISKRRNIKMFRQYGMLILNFFETAACEISVYRHQKGIEWRDTQYTWRGIVTLLWILTIQHSPWYFREFLPTQWRAIFLHTKKKFINQLWHCRFLEDSEWQGLGIVGKTYI